MLLNTKVKDISSRAIGLPSKNYNLTFLLEVIKYPGERISHFPHHLYQSTLRVAQNKMAFSQAFRGKKSGCLIGPAQMSNLQGNI